VKFLTFTFTALAVPVTVKPFHLPLSTDTGKISNDILVPFFPQVQDMILIKDDNPVPWLAKVLAIQERAKTCKIWYYMEDTERPGQQ